MAEPSEPQDQDVLAAELALGLLDDAERVRALRLQLADRGFRQAVARWEARFVALFDAIPSRAPGDAVWPRIESALDEQATLPMRRAASGWRIGAIVAGIAACLLAALLLFQTRAPLPPAPTAPPLIAQLTGSAGEPLVVARYDGDAGRLDLRTTNLPHGAKAPELWVIPAGGAPRSLGLIAREGPSQVAPTPPIRDLLREGAKLAVTMEPADGAPHAAPSGAILGAAPLSRL